MRSLLAGKHCSTSRCIVVPAAAVSLSLLLAALLAASNNVCVTFPNYRRFPFRRPFSSLTTRRGRGGGGCDIFRGNWVPDPDAPYYTNDTCSVIHEHYDCIKYGKPDLGFVKWRWRPDGCDLPRFDPWPFLDMMRGKSIAFVGDSLARNHKDSLICLLTRAAEPTPSWPSSKQTVYYYGKYNFTVTNFWAPYLVRHEQIDEDGPAHTGLWNLYLDEPDDVWAAHVPEFDYAVVSMLYEAGELVGCPAPQRHGPHAAVRAAHGHARGAAGAVRRRRPCCAPWTRRSTRAGSGTRTATASGRGRAAAGRRNWRASSLISASCRWRNLRRRRRRWRTGVAR